MEQPLPQVDISTINPQTNALMWIRQGLGDQIVSAGLVHRMSYACAHVYVLCRQHHLASLQHLYHAIPNVCVLSNNQFVPDKLDPDFQEISLIAEQLHAQVFEVMQVYDPTHHTNVFKSGYACYNLPYEARWWYWPGVKSTVTSQALFKHVTQGMQDYVCVHNHSSERSSYDVDFQKGNRVHDLPHIHISPIYSQNLFDWYDVLVNAVETHVVVSSPFHLLEQIHAQCKGPIYFHHIRDHTFIEPQTDVLPYVKNFTLIDYPFKQWN
jgi:hypothetical protein